MKNKNVCAIKIILSLSRTLGEYLDTSWIQVLKVISQLEKVQIINNSVAELNKSSSTDSTDKHNKIINLLADELKQQSRYSFY
jgi:brefeldin A-inhibited guanine nucleotide-exchange protein